MHLSTPNQQSSQSSSTREGATKGHTAATPKHDDEELILPVRTLAHHTLPVTLQSHTHSHSRTSDNEDETSSDDEYSGAYARRAKSEKITTINAATATTAIAATAAMTASSVGITYDQFNDESIEDSIQQASDESNASKVFVHAKDGDLAQQDLDGDGLRHRPRLKRSPERTRNAAHKAVRKFARAYDGLLTRSARSRLCTQLVTSFLLFLASDWICQMFIEHVAAYQARRALVFASYGMLYAPLAHEWYMFLHGLQTRGALRNARTAHQLGVMILLDQLLFSAFSNVWFYFHIGIFEHASLKRGIDLNREKFWPTMYFNWAVWPFAQIINFFYVPVSYRVLYDNAVTFWWNIGLSYLAFAWHVGQASQDVQVS